MLKTTFIKLVSIPVGTYLENDPLSKIVLFKMFGDHQVWFVNDLQTQIFNVVLNKRTTIYSIGFPYV